MVYSKILMYYGVVVDIKGLLEFCTFVSSSVLHMSASKKQTVDTWIKTIWDPKEDTEDLLYELVSAIDDTIKRYTNIRIVNYPCHSNLSYKRFIIGRKLKSIKRLHMHCDQCTSYNKSYSNCDTCFGMTEHGHYDVYKIYNQVVTLENRDVSLCKWCLYDKCTDAHSCPRCRYETFEHNAVYETDKFEVDRRLQPWFEAMDMQVVYCLDDCTSCT
jgi:hypothetical protein